MARSMPPTAPKTHHMAGRLRSSGGDFAITRHRVLIYLTLGSQNLRIVPTLRTAVDGRNIAEVRPSGFSERSRNTQR